VTEVRHIGYWRSAHHPDYPDPAQLVDDSWDQDERSTVVQFLSYGQIARAYMGYSNCRICSLQTNGSLEYTDGVYQWPQGLAHYVEEHAVRLPLEFIVHAVRKVDEAEAQQPTLDWWLSQTT
jgi:hypothetical protein